MNHALRAHIIIIMVIHINIDTPPIPKSPLLPRLLAI